MEEKVVEQLVLVGFGKERTEALLVFGHKHRYAFNEPDSLFRSNLDAFEQKEYPFLPSGEVGNGVTLRVTDMLYQPVVCALVMGDVTTEVKDGEIQQAVDHEIEHRDDATCTTVAVVEGVDACKLVMNDGHFDQWVDVVQRGH